MPRKEDIERFAQVLTSLGNEPEIRAARSKAAEEAPAPDDARPGEATELPLDDLEGGEAGPEGIPDLFQGLADLGDEGGPGPEAHGTEPAEPGPGEGLDFASLFGEEPPAEGIEDLGEPPPKAEGPEEPAAEEPFSLPEGGVESLGSDLSALEALPEEPGDQELGGAVTAPGTGEPFAPAEAPGPEEPGPFSMSEEPGPFPMPGEPGVPPTEPMTGEEAGGGAESFELPDLDNLTFAEPSATGSEEPPAEPPAGDESPFELPGELGPGPEEPPGEPSFEAPGETSATAGFEPQASEATAFDLDTATLGDLGGEPGGPTPPAQIPSAETPAAEAEAPRAELGGEPAGLEGLGDLGDLDEFSLPESAGQFGVEGFPSGEAEEQPAAPPPAAPPRIAERRGRPERRPAPQAPVEKPEAAEIPEGEVSLTPEQFARLRSSLGSLPRNLKIIVQDLIGEGMVTGPDLTALLRMLVRGASAQEIAALAGRISGKRIRIPAGYEKRSGKAFEAEQRTFAYAFRENFLPLVRVVAITVLVGALFGFLGYNYFYRPLFAWVNYRSGYAQIASDRFTLANERFARATSVWPLKQWYYRYAEAFAARRNYPLAEGKYDELLKAWPLDKKGILDYARLESTTLADYPKADSLLARYLNVHGRDYDVLLASGDNDLAWADRVQSRYEAARRAYATLLQDYGVRDELLFRMLRYFIRTDNGEEVERLRAYYAARPDVKVDAAAFAELGGYLVDHRRLDYVQQVLFRADRNQPGLPGVQYNLARYYRIVQDLPDEKKALDATERILDLTRSSAPLTTRRLNLEIDTHTRLGEYYYTTRQFIPAEKELQDAIRLVETYQQQKIIDKRPLYGRPYAVLGDLSYYFEDNLGNAALQYQKAGDNLYTSPLLTYKIGYVQYVQKDYKAAMESFAQAEDASVYPSTAEEIAAVPAATPSGGDQPAAASGPSTGEPPRNLLYALGNAFYQRGDFFAAQASFLRLRDRLESRRASLGTLHPEDRADDRALLDTIVKVDNNLGVTLARLAERTGDRRNRSEALVYLSDANEIAASLARSPETVKRSEDRTLPSLNMQGILFPVRGFVPQIYSDLPKDFESVSW